MQLLSSYQQYMALFTNPQKIRATLMDFFIRYSVDERNCKFIVGQEEGNILLNLSVDTHSSERRPIHRKFLLENALMSLMSAIGVCRFILYELKEEKKFKQM